MKTFEMGALDSLHDAQRSMIGALCEYEGFRGQSMVSGTDIVRPDTEQMVRGAIRNARAAILQLQNFVNLACEDEPVKPKIRKAILAYLLQVGPASSRACFQFAMGYCKFESPPITFNQVVNELHRLVDINVIKQDEKSNYVL